MKSNIFKMAALTALTVTVLLSFTSCGNKDDDHIGNTGNTTVTDADGNVYHTVTIGTQTWMVENLKTTKYNDGTAIPKGSTDNTAWDVLTTGAYCWYNNDAVTYKDRYGALYNWYAVNTGKLAPKGWHVPTDDEWMTLSTYLGGEEVSGGSMKSTIGWNSPNTGATNSSGFTALPGGSRFYSVDSGKNGFYGDGSDGSWWSSTQHGTRSVGITYLLYNNTNLYRSYEYDKFSGYSVRCVRDI